MKVRDMSREAIDVLIRDKDKALQEEIFGNFLREHSEYRQVVEMVSSDLSEPMAEVIATRNALNHKIGEDMTNQILGMIFKYFISVAEILESEVEE